jgi:lipopolysaccharide heptosyltransferase II
MVRQAQSICIIRISSMGDIVLVSPLIRMLRAQYPSARIDMVVAARFAELVMHNPYISQIISLDTTTGVSGIVRQSRAARRANSSRRYDIVLDLQVNIRSWFYRLMLGKRTYLLDKFRQQKRNLVSRKIGIGEDVIPVAERYLQAAEALGIQDDMQGAELWLPEERHLGYYPPARRKNANNAPPKRIAIAPGARHATKRWLPERFSETALLLAEKYGSEIVLLGGIDDQQMCDDVQSRLHIPVIDATGMRSVVDTIRILDTCDLLVCNDSGIMHIAAARHVPVCAVFGSTVRELGFAPFRAHHTIIEADLDCRPCTHIGRAVCPEGHFQCMNLVTSADAERGIERDIFPIVSV